MRMWSGWFPDTETSWPPSRPTTVLSQQQCVNVIDDIDNNVIDIRGCVDNDDDKWQTMTIMTNDNNDDKADQHNNINNNKEIK